MQHLSAADLMLIESDFLTASEEPKLISRHKSQTGLKGRRYSSADVRLAATSSSVADTPLSSPKSMQSVIELHADQRRWWKRFTVSRDNGVPSSSCQEEERQQEQSIEPTAVGQSTGRAAIKTLSATQCNVQRWPLFRDGAAPLDRVSPHSDCCGASARPKAREQRMERSSSAVICGDPIFVLSDSQQERVAKQRPPYDRDSQPLCLGPSKNLEESGNFDLRFDGICIEEALKNIATSRNNYLPAPEWPRIQVETGEAFVCGLGSGLSSSEELCCDRLQVPVRSTSDSDSTDANYQEALEGSFAFSLKEAKSEPGLSERDDDRAFLSNGDHNEHAWVKVRPMDMDCRSEIGELLLAGRMEDLSDKCANFNKQGESSPPSRDEPKLNRWAANFETVHIDVPLKPPLEFDGSCSSSTPKGPETSDKSDELQDKEMQQEVSREGETHEEQNKSFSRYAESLTHMYQNKGAPMEEGGQFRSLLYNTICCLLSQDDYVLESQSVGKLLEVIRCHLQSSSCSSLSSGTSHNLSPSSSGRVSSDWTSAGAPEAEARDRPAAKTMTDCELPVHNNELAPNGQRHKSVQLRRVSSLSYYDDDTQPPVPHWLSSAGGQTAGQKGAPQSGWHDQESGLSGSISSGRGRDSPWVYEALASDGPYSCCRASPTPDDREGGQRNPRTSQPSELSVDQLRRTSATSQSSLELQTGRSYGPVMASPGPTSSDLMNDSGNATMYEYGVGATSSCLETCSADSTSSGGRSSRGQPTQQAPSSATFESPTGALESRKREEEEDNYAATSSCTTAIGRLHVSPAGPSPDQKGGQEAPDARQRRAELEWTLNRLINEELSENWLAHGQDTLKRAIRKVGVPKEIRAKVWMVLIEQAIGHNYDTKRLLQEAGRTIQRADSGQSSTQIRSNFPAGQCEVDQNDATYHEDSLDEETRAIMKQIELDINRTMPENRLFDEGAEGGLKLRRILVAYSIHVNRAVAYCQGFNFIVALLLSVFEGDEQKALKLTSTHIFPKCDTISSKQMHNKRRGLICIVDHIFPSKYYFDHYLTGARADQFLLADFICDQLIRDPTFSERELVEGVTSSITLNWFISLFHGAVPTLTRLVILDNFMLEGVKALFKFTMAILYLAFQTSPPSSCESMATIRNTARGMYDIKLLLSIVDKIRLPKESYFAIRRSFYMVQSSFDSDHFYMQTLSNEASRSLCVSKPLNLQPGPETKPPAISSFKYTSNAPLSPPPICGGSKLFAKCSWRPSGLQPGSRDPNSGFMVNCLDKTMQQERKWAQSGSRSSGLSCPKRRVRTSANRSKVCVQNLGTLGRSHLRIMDSNVRANERSLMSPMRNCLVIGLSNCSKHLVIARQSSRRNFRSLRDQDLTLHIHELAGEIFDGFYLEEMNSCIVMTQQGEVLKIEGAIRPHQEEPSKRGQFHTETLMLRDTFHTHLPDGPNEKIKLRQAAMDQTTKLLWVYVDCEQQVAQSNNVGQAGAKSSLFELKFKYNNPFCQEETVYASRRESSSGADDELGPICEHQASLTSEQRASQRGAGSTWKQRKILIIDVVTFDIFSAFTIPASFGQISNLRASLVAYFQLSNPMSNQFSSRIVQIGPDGHYEQLLSFSDVVDYLVSVPESFKRRCQDGAENEHDSEDSSQKYSSLRRLLTRSISFNSFASSQLRQRQTQEAASSRLAETDDKIETVQSERGTLKQYYRTLIKSYSTSTEDTHSEGLNQRDNERPHSSASQHLAGNDHSTLRASKRKQAQQETSSPKLTLDNVLRSLMSSSLIGNFSELSETNYIPVNMTFIFRNGKIALFEFTESYAIHTRESQLDRYDYSRVIDVNKRGDDFVVTILTVFDKLIKIII